MSDRIYEYCGIQRTGKTTLMVGDLMNKLLNKYWGFSYVPDEVYANFKLHIEGVHCLTNDQMLEVLIKARRERWVHKCFLVDECSQPPLFYARNSKDKVQTELVTALWQYPKLFCTFQYSSNIGNSVDVQQRDATHVVIMPKKYNHHEYRAKETIDFRVIHAYEQWTYDDTYLCPAETQKYYNSFDPVI